MIRNSDILFGRTVAAYKFTDRETIRQVIKEISTLQVLGIDKRMPQIMFERAYLKKEQIYAVLESLLQCHQIKRVIPLNTYLFTEEDDKKLYEYLKIPYGVAVSESAIPQIPEEQQEKKSPISHTNLVLCLNIKQTLEKANIKVRLMNVIYDKKLLHSRFKDIIPDIAQKRQNIVSPDEFNEQQSRKNVAILLAQIAIVNHKMTSEQYQQTLSVWDTIGSLGIDLKYSEVLFYMGMMDERTIGRMASFLASISGMDQHPRFLLFRLTDQEQGYFEQLQEKGCIDNAILQQGNELLSRLQEEGLCSIRLSDVLLIKKLITREDVIQKWTEMRKKDAQKAVERMEIEKTDEARISYEKVEEDIAQSEKVLKQAKDAEKDYIENTQNVAREILSETQEAEDFGKELDKTFRTTKEERKQAIHEELKLLKNKLKTANRSEARTINTVIRHYQRTKSAVQFYFFILGIFLAMMLAALLWHKHSQETPEELPNNKPAITDTKTPPVPNIDAELAKADTLKKEFQYQQAIEIYQKLEKSISQETILNSLQEKRKNLELQTRLFEALGNIVQQEHQPVLFTFRGRPKSRIGKVFPDGILVYLSQGQTSARIPWVEVPARELYSIFKIHEMLKLFPWEMALFCAEHNLVEESREALASYVLQFPQEKEKAWAFCGAITKKLVPSEGYSVYKGKLYTKQEIKELGEQTIPDVDKD